MRVFDTGMYHVQQPFHGPELPVNNEAHRLEGRKKDRFRHLVGLHLSDRRKAAGLSLRDAASRCGFSAPALSQLERHGMNLTLDNVLCLLTLYSGSDASSDLGILHFIWRTQAGVQ